MVELFYFFERTRYPFRLWLQTALELCSAFWIDNPWSKMFWKFVIAHDHLESFYLSEFPKRIEVVNPYWLKGVFLELQEVFLHNFLTWRVTLFCHNTFLMSLVDREASEIKLWRNNFVDHNQRTSESKMNSSQWAQFNESKELVDLI